MLTFMGSWLLLFAASVVVDVRAKHAAKSTQPYLSPLDGTEERVPARLRMWQFLLWAVFAAIVAIGYAAKREYMYSSPWFAHILVAVYCAWVYRRGREPKVMEGFREFPDPPSLLRKP
jgi:hypothetical protein